MTRRVTMRQLEANVEHINYLLGDNFPGRCFVQDGGTYYRLCYQRNTGGDPVPLSPAVATKRELMDVMETVATIMLIDRADGWH